VLRRVSADVPTASATERGIFGTLDLNLLMLFPAIVSAGSITRATSRLRVPKATLSRKLRELERQIGAVLLKRGPRGLEMTEVGRALHHHCERIAETAFDASQIAAEMQSLVRGTVRVSVPFGLSKTWVSEAMSDFALRHPDVRLVVHVTNRWVDVSEEPYDVAIHIGQAKNLDIPTRRLAELPRGLYASPEYCARRGIPLAPQDLMRHDCIVLENQVADGLWNLGGAHGNELTISPRMTTTDVVLAREMAVAGVGIAMLTHVVSEAEIRHGHLRRILPDLYIPPVVIAAMFAERRYVPARIRMFVDVMAETLKRAHPGGFE
jgi:DNA-binding transcriptional LysR family regulator